MNNVDNENNENNENDVQLMKISVEVNGEFITTEVAIDSTVQAIFDGGHLRGIETLAIRVNGRPATPNTRLRAEDTVQTAPVGGRLA